MRLRKLFRALLLTAIAATATFFILLGMGKIAPAEGAPRGVYSRSLTDLNEDEIMCLVHTPPQHFKGEIWKEEDRYQIVHRIPDQPRADDDFETNPGTLLSAIQMAAHVTRAQVEVPSDLAKLPLRGDWAVRETASVDEKLKALEKIIAYATGRNIVFEKRSVEREVAIAQGNWIMRDAQQNASVRLSIIRERDDDDRSTFQRTFGEGDVKAFLRFVENQTGRRVFDRMTQPPPRRIFWSEDFRRVRRPVKNRDPVDQFLMSLADQTLLSFEIDDAQVEVWFVREQGPATRPKDNK